MKLSDHPFIQSISAQNREGIVGEIEVLHLAPGDIIFRENSAPDALYLNLHGLVEFTKSKPDGYTRLVSTCKEGSFFGEVGVLTGEKRSLNASAQTKCTIGRVDKATVSTIINDAEPAKKVLESVINHLKRTTAQYIEETTRQEKLSLVGTMISSILHDFRNPFSIISLGAHILNQRHGSDPRSAKICANIETQIRRMVDMANDLSAFTRGDDQIKLLPLSAQALLDRFKELNGPFFQNSKVSIEIRANDVRLHGDESKLLRVLQNLVANAIEAIQQTEQPGKIVISAIDQGTTIKLCVADNGPGIPEAIQSRFFEPFITHGKSGGTGLGTAIVRSIIDAHHGTIIFSTSAAGTTFTIQLPQLAGSQSAASSA